MGLLGGVALIGALWWGLFGLKPYQISAAELQARYAYSPPQDLALQLAPIKDLAQDFSFTSFDGSIVNGRIRYPSDPATAGAPFPLLIAMHGMGRSHWRWWQAEYKGGKTLEHTHKLTELALQRGHAVIAIDARRSGARKDPKVDIEQLMDDLHLWGQREPYEAMLVDTVRDHRLLLDWVTRLPRSMRAASRPPATAWAVRTPCCWRVWMSGSAMSPPSLPSCWTTSWPPWRSRICCRAWRTTRSGCSAPTRMSTPTAAPT
ncbi:hypothetical protein [Paucibacter sp. M5-1]|uniref:hypothetical protein n=1 Tax=Paucibacter sp. M5-1 TaxID=3015998 RepID=UPI0022B862A5|nr:hypothetical protein [Paucibacter sp. M5-1]MCZ7880992.1 hypothetical protein [Paucibacter sp. M5-1]